MTIRKSAEDYLEQILILHEEKGFARSVDIANGLSVSKPSVSFAMKQLRENGYITMDKDSFIELTPKGREIADRIYARHRVLTAILTHIGVDAETAREDACKIEHDISDTTFEVIRRYVDEQ
ncbi:MAG: metal-dependent transcriptional regulator [Clostridia bacterium]|nr:metal-dependent transcriptional regulator [Clostridia bacterium]